MALACAWLGCCASARVPRFDSKRPTIIVTCVKRTQAHHISILLLPALTPEAPTATEPAAGTTLPETSKSLRTGETRLPILLQLVVGRTVHGLVRRTLCLAECARLAAILICLGGVGGLLPLRRRTRRIDWLPAAVAPLRPAIGCMLIGIAVMAGIDVAILGFHRTAAVAVYTPIARTLRPGRGLEGARRSSGIAAAGSVDGLVGAGECAGAPARIRVCVLAGRAAYAGARIVIAGIG